MTDLTSQPWFWWAVALVIALPLLLLVLTEIYGALVRRGSPAAPLVAMLRNYAVPAGALLVLFTQVWEIDGDETWIRILATVFGFLLIVLVLAALNVVLFQQAARGTWRERMPSIFIDIARLVLTVTGLGLLFALVWGANVGGLFAALGVTSIVLGLALQNAVGSILSGLFLLFEQPFRLGDWLDDGNVRGRVVEVNWRAVHIETANGVQIIPNATLAGASFTNLSQPAGRHAVTVGTKFAADDPPDTVRRMLDRIAFDLPIAGIEPEVSTASTGSQGYATTIAIRSPADADDVTTTFLRWTWYAARRSGLHLDGAGDSFSTPQRALSALRELAPSLHLRDEEIETVASRMHVEKWATGELLQRIGEVPDALRFVVGGRVALHARTPDGDRVPMGELSPGEMLGLASLTRQPATVGASAVDELDVLAAPVPLVEELVHSHPALARELGRQLDLLRVRVQARLGEVPDDLGVPALASSALTGSAAGVGGARRGLG